MENPVDHAVDLGLVNYVKHPSNPDYIIYRFADSERADSFEAALFNEKIWFEKSSEKGRIKTFILFGVHKSDYDATQRINFQIEAKHKKPFIPHSGLRYLILGISTIVMTLAIVGYCKQQQKLRSYKEEGTLRKETVIKNKKQ